MHNAVRFALVPAEGRAIVFEFRGARHLNDGLDCGRRPVGAAALARHDIDLFEAREVMETARLIKSADELAAVACAIAAAEAGMTLCVESYIGAVGGHEGVKLEQQILITPDGPEPLSRFPLEAALLRGPGGGGYARRRARNNPMHRKRQAERMAEI